MLNLCKNGITRNHVKIFKHLRRNYGYENAPKRRETFKKLAYAATAILAANAAYKRLAVPDTGLKIQKISAIDNEDCLRDKFNFIGSVVKKCAPAVVYVEIQDPRRFDPETNEPIIISNGSGFIVKEDGWILTNAHVVINKPHAIITVKLYDGSIFIASVEDADMNIDLALLKINCKRKLPSLQFGKADDVTVGEWVIALGSPLSLSHSVTAGIISSANRAAHELGLRNNSMEYIQTDASITFGNSGGPLVNLDGDVIGINNLRITAGISFAIPIGYAKKFLQNSKHTNKTNDTCEITQTKQLGMTTLTMSESIIKELYTIHKFSPEDMSAGVLVWKVTSDSPAHKSGLKAGDVITHINGKPIKRVDDIYTSIKNKGRVLTLAIISEGKKKEIVLKYK